MSRRKATTKAQFNAFKRSFYKWQREFGLTEFDIVFELEDMPSEYATIDADVPNCTALVSFCKYVPTGARMDTETAKATGKHEALHLLTGRMRHLAMTRFVSEDEVWQADEQLVRVLEKVI